MPTQTDIEDFIKAHKAQAVITLPPPLTIRFVRDDAPLARLDPSLNVLTVNFDAYHNLPTANVRGHLWHHELEHYLVYKRLNHAPERVMNDDDAEHESEASYYSTPPAADLHACKTPEPIDPQGVACEACGTTEWTLRGGDYYCEGCGKRVHAHDWRTHLKAHLQRAADKQANWEAAADYVINEDVIAPANAEADKAGVLGLDALRTRGHVKVEPSPEAWAEWAKRGKIEPEALRFPSPEEQALRWMLDNCATRSVDGEWRDSNGASLHDVPDAIEATIQALGYHGKEREKTYGVHAYWVIDFEVTCFPSQAEAHAKAQVLEMLKARAHNDDVIGIEIDITEAL